MSLQDDIHAVQNALEGTPAGERFDAIMAVFYHNERTFEELIRWCSAVEKGAFYKMRIERGDWKELLSPDQLRKSR